MSTLDTINGRWGRGTQRPRRPAKTAERSIRRERSTEGRRPVSSTISNQYAWPSHEIERMQHVLFELSISLLRTQA
ncbi:DUF4113 domain-containing protein [Stutzerimonas stutzeri]|uniref:DUF4113 domain-containing protein n=1 Tax=Stutzerimonas stutzeri TaxID=316 RepID=UPI001E32472A|nr:DUF4113 domain-containing protein [Stutzerimonas stutzeri]